MLFHLGGGSMECRGCWEGGSIRRRPAGTKACGQLSIPCLCLSKGWVSLEKNWFVWCVLVSQGRRLSGYSECQGPRGAHVHVKVTETVV